MEAIEQALSGGDRRSLGRTEEVIAWVLADSGRLPELFACLFSADEIVRMRAGDALEKVCRQHPDWLLPYRQRLLTAVAAIQQPSVQWHLAQMLGEIPLSDQEKTQAGALLKHNLARAQDWIVINLTLETLAQFAREDTTLRADFRALLEQQQNSRHKSVRSRVKKLLQEFAQD
ncbi:MAG: hypothetical protein HXY40_04810 [Chloroflexi bacterium]|nr:hypothetical protein [Chloroflexota bacterium]